MLARFRIKPIIGWLVRITGAAMIIAATMAELLGLDRSGGWGPARVFLLIVGLTLVVLPSIGDLIRQFDKAHHRQRSESKSGYSTEIPHLGHQLSRTVSDGAHARRREVSLSLMLLVIFGISVAMLTWLISFGRWKSWPETTNYYHLLADGFRAGETHLLVEPDPRLLEIENPYVIGNRSDFPYLWDASLFDGKYFLYWGPAPALFVIAFEGIIRSPVGDHHLVWLFSILTVLFLMLILRMFWREVFPQLSAASVVPIALAAALINPLLWLVSRPAVYEVAVAGGQAFFMGGVFCLAPLLWRNRLHRGRIALGGTFWVLAVGSRISLVFAVQLLPIGLALFILLSRRGTDGSWRGVLAELGYLLSPLVLGAVLLAWYNFDRFGSILELGQRYQLGQLNMRDDFNLVVTLGNIPMNLYNYFLNLPSRLNVFPYLKPAWGEYAIPFLRYTAPETYSTEKVTGILITSPVLIIGILPIVGWLRAVWQNIGESTAEKVPTYNPFVGAPLGNLYTMLAVGVLLLSIPMLAVSFISMRHEFDIVPMMSLGATLGYALTYQRTGDRPVIQRLFLLLMWLAVFWTIGTSLLLSFTGYESNFEKMNFELFDRLTRLFTL